MDRAKWAACAIVLLLTVACGGGDDERAETVSQPSPTPTVPASPDTASQDDDGDDDGADDAGAAEPVEAEAALLRVADMPTGWSRTAEQDDGDDEDAPAGDPTLCDTELGEQFETISDASVQFSAGQMGPFVDHAVGVYEDGQAEQALTAVLDALGSCEEWTEDTDDGPVTYRASPMSFPTVGDQTVAVRLDVEAEMMAATADMIAWRRGDALSMVMASAVFDAPDSEQIEEIVAAADERLAEID